MSRSVLSAGLFRARLLAFSIAVFGATIGTSFSQQSAVPVSQPAAGTSPAARGKLNAKTAALPLMFEKNVGQPGAGGDFTAQGKGYTLQLNAGQMSLRVVGPNGKNDQVGISFDGADRYAFGQALDKLPTLTNYFIGRDRAQWRTAVNNFGKVRYASVYPGIDVLFYGTDGQIEHDFVLAPHADPKAVVLQVNGAKSLAVDSQNDIVITTANGEFLLKKPDLYQESGSKRVPVRGSYQVLSNNRIGFKVDNYDKNRALTIDPVLVFATYVGSPTNGSNANGVDVDSTTGDVYFGGVVFSDFTAGASPAVTVVNHGTPSAAGIAFVAKLAAAANGSTFAWVTYIGGTGGDSGSAVAFDHTNSQVAIAGTTNSSDFPTSTNAASTSFTSGKSAGFVTALDSTTGGTTKYYSTYVTVGTPAGVSTINGVVIDSSGNLYVSGATTDTALTSTDCSTVVGTSNNSFVAKLTSPPNGTTGAITSLVIFNGATAGDSSTAQQAAVTSTGSDLFVVGNAAGHFPTDAHVPGTFNQNAINGTSAAYFADVQFANHATCPGISNVVHSRLYHDNTTPSSDTLTSIAIAPTGAPQAGTIYVGGETNSTTLSTLDTTSTLLTLSANGLQGAVNNGGEDVLAIHIDPTKLSTADGVEVLTTTEFGGSGTDFASGVSVDKNGQVFVVGVTQSLQGSAPAFPTSNAIPSLSAAIAAANTKTAAGFVAEFNQNFATASFSTLVGSDTANQDAINGGVAATGANAGLSGDVVAIAGTFKGLSSTARNTTASAFLNSVSSAANGSAYVGLLEYSGTASAATLAANSFNTSPFTSSPAIVSNSTATSLSYAFAVTTSGADAVFNFPIVNGKLDPAGFTAPTVSGGPVCTFGSGGVTCTIPANTTNGSIVVNAKTLTGLTASSSFVATATLADGANSVITPASETTYVAPVLVTPAVTANNKTYDATANASIASCTLTGVISTNNSSSVDNTGCAASTTPADNQFASKDQATGILVTANNISLTNNVTLADTSSAYQLSTTTATTNANIIAKTLAVTITSNPTKTYDGSATASLTQADFTVAATGIGTETVTVTTGSYSGTYQTSGGTTTANASTNPSNGAAKVSASGLTYTAGGGANLNNYSIATTASGAGTINAKTLTVAITSNPTKTYNGTSTANLTQADFTVTATGIGTEVVSVTTGSYPGTYQTMSAVTTSNASTNPTNPAKQVAASGLAYTGSGGADVNNYSIATTASGAGTINAKTLAVTITSNPTKTYDGASTANLTQADFTVAATGVGTEVVSVTTGSYTGTYQTVSAVTTSNASTNPTNPAKQVSASGLAYTGSGGADVNNYSIATTASGAGTINAKTLAVTITSNPTKTYNGTSTANLTQADFTVAATGIGTETVSVTTGSYSGTYQTSGGATTANASTNPSNGAAKVSASGLSYTAGGGADLNNYSIATTASGAGTINAKTLTVSITSNPTKTYDGSANAALHQTDFTVAATGIGTETVSVTTGSYSGMYQTSGGTTTANASANPSNAAAKVMASGLAYTGGGGADVNNYSIATTASGAGTINVKTLAVSITSNPTKTYDGSSTASLTQGDFAVAATGIGTEIVSVATGSYSGTYQTSVGATTANASTNPSNGAAKVSASGLTYTAGGGADLNNYSIATTASGAGTINAKTLTVSITSNPTKTYDGSANAPLHQTDFTVAATGIGTETVSVTTGSYSGMYQTSVGATTANASTNPSNGAAKVSASGLTYTAGGGADLNNYSIATTASGAGAINAKTLAVSITSNPTKTYDGSANATLHQSDFTVAATGVGTETVSVTTGSYTGTYQTSGGTTTANASANPSNAAAKVMASGLAYTGGGGADVNNYSIATTASGAGTISVAHLTVTADPQSKTYDTKTFTGGGGTFTATLSGFVNGETDAGLRGTGALSGAAGFTGAATTAVNFGSYAITPTVNTLASGNYDFGFSPANLVNGTLTINKAPLTITALANSRIYDATRNAAAVPMVSGLQGSDSATGLVETYDTKDVGMTKTLTVTAFTVNDNNGGANYSVSTVTNTNGVITPKALTESGLLVPASKVYDATTNATVSGTAVLQPPPENAGTGSTADGKPYAGDTVSIAGTAVGTYQDAGGNPNANVGTAIQVAFSGLSLQGAQAGDYTLTIQSPQGATISQATPTVKIFQSNADVTGATATFTYNAGAQGLTSTVTGVPGEPATLTISSITYAGGTAPTSAGSYPVVATFNGNSNYKSASANATEVINKATPTVKILNGNTDVTSSAATFLYNAGAQGLTTTVTGVPGEPATLTITSITYNGNSTVPTSAGTYAVVATFGGNGNYNSANAQATEFITKATPTVKIMNGATDVTGGTATFTYNANPQGLTTSVTGVPGEQATLTVNSLTYTNSSQAPTNAGTYAVLASFNGNGNYNSANVSATEVINQATPTVKILNGNTDVTNGTATFTYTAMPQGLSSTVTGVPGETATLTVSSLTYSGNNQAPTNAATYAVVATFSGSNNYGQMTSTATETIGQAALTVTAKSATKPYGQSLSFVGNEFTSAGLLGSDSVTSVTLASAGAAGTATITGGPYLITPSAAVGIGLPNYQIAYSTGTLTIIPVALTVTANARSKTYGQSVTFAGTEFTAIGLLNADSVTSVTLTSSGAAVTATTTGSPYTITPSAALGTGLSNYTITYPTGKLTVNPASLSITANSLRKTYGQNVTFTGNEFTTSGLLNGDTVTSVTLTSGGAAATAAVGGSPYTIAPSAPVGNGLSNYAPTFVAGTLTVAPAHLTVTAVNQSRIYGSANPTASFSLTGFQNGENQISANVTGSPTLSDATLPTTVIGTYPITVVDAGNLSAPNYDFLMSNFVNATLTVTPAPLSVTANNISKTYGQTTTFAGTEFTSSGLQNNDSVTSVTLASAGAAATATVTGSPYTITPSAAQGTGLSNYTITYPTGKLTVNAAPLSITANSIGKTYGQTVTFAGTEFTTSGLLNGDTVTSATLTSSGAAATAPVGGSPYSITPSAPVGNGLSNYTTNFVSGTLSVASAHLTATANPQTHIFGSPLPGLTATLSGFVNGEALGTSGVTGSASCTSPVAVLSPVASYTITCTQGTLSAQNYDFPAANFATGNFVVTQATSQSVVTGVANGSNLAQLTFADTVNPQFAGIPTGTVTFQDNGSPLGAGASGSSTVTLASGSATFTLNLNQLAAGQHNITAVYNGDVNFKAATVVAASVTVNATVSVSPGAPIPAQTVTLSNPTATDITYNNMKCSILSSLGQPVANTTCLTSTASLTVPHMSSASFAVQLATNTASAQPAPTQAALHMRALNGLWLAMPAVFFLPFAAPASTRRKLLRRNVLTILGLSILLVFLMLSMGCGGGGFNNPNNSQPGSGTNSTTQPGSYIVQVFGTGPSGQTSLASIPFSVGF